MNAINIIMASSTSANPHNAPNQRIETIIRKRKISAITLFVFGILLIIAGCLLASFESQRFSVSFIIFGIIGIIFAFIHWISAERISIALRKFNRERIRQRQLQAQNSSAYHLQNRDFEGYISSAATGLPSYEQSLSPQTEIPPTYDEAIKTKAVNVPPISSVPIHSISLSIDQSSTQLNAKESTSH